jgi:hypothetical protein
MLEKVYVRKQTPADLEVEKGNATYYLDLAERRLERLRARQARDPHWQAVDPMIDEVVTIATRIEEWEAVRDDLKDDLALLTAEIDRRRGQAKGAPPPSQPRRYEARRESTPQLSLF